MTPGLFDTTGDTLAQKVRLYLVLAWAAALSLFLAAGAVVGIGVLVVNLARG